MQMIPEQDREFLRVKFAEQMRDNVTIMVFARTPASDSGPDCQFCTETEELVAELASLTDKIAVESQEYSPENRLVKALNIERIPALVISQDKIHSVRFYGIPGGFEFSALVDDIIDVSRSSTELSAGVRDKIRSLEKDVHIQVFVTPTCPYCPAAGRAAHQMAIENPIRICADIVEAAEFPDLVDIYGVSAVPTIVINGKVQFEGASEEDFADRIMQAVA
jgi:glutaredoxin-like protein